MSALAEARTPPSATAPVPVARMPRQIPLIIASEGCERFSFYEMRNTLTIFLASAFFANLPGRCASGGDGRRGEAGRASRT
jgi:dipeptide/tripeptide permease